MSLRPLSALAANKSGVAAVELALVAPVLALVLVGILDGWKLATRQTEAQIAANAGARYYLQGGVDDAAAQTFAVQAWPNRPADGAVSVSRTCSCSGAAASCSSTCSGTSTLPQVVVTITATTNWTGAMLSKTLNPSDTVRVR